MIRLFVLTALTMVAFAANSLLNRAALVDGASDPIAFSAVRVLSGALVLAALAMMRHGLPRLTGRNRVIGAGALTVYLLGFSLAYVALDAGIGALVLFGVVQVTMFGGALFSGERPPLLRWLGAGLALAGLAWLVSPGQVEIPVGAVLLMAVAAVGWGVYSLVGRGARDAIGETAANFVCATPLVLIVWSLRGGGIDATGIVLGIVSGAVTSGLGYALWYTVLPGLDRTIAALAQLTVPVLALVGGLLLLGEVVTAKILLASAVILGGVALGVLGSSQRRIGSKGS